MNHNKIDQYWGKIKIGDKQALKDLFECVYAILCDYSFQITCDYQLSEELVQDVLQKIWVGREYILVTSSFKSYLFKAVRNKSIDVVREKQNRKNVFYNHVSEGAWLFFEETYGSDDYIIEKVTVKETYQSVICAINDLPSQCQKAFKLSRFENKTNTEIAEIMNISVHTVRSHIYKALLKITEQLQKFD